VRDDRRFAEALSRTDPRESSVWLISDGASGAIGMTALVLLYPRTPIARLVGSDIAHAVPLTLIAGVGHWLLGSVDWVLLGSLVIRPRK
jgi:uncharacterized membrane protein YfcA